MLVMRTETDGWTVRYGTGERIGALKDFIVDTKASPWEVRSLVIRNGLGRGAHLLDLPTPHLEVDKPEKAFVKTGHADLRDAPEPTSSADHLRLSSLAGMKVYSSDEKLLGKAYDFAIATATQHWMVWRFLVDVPGLRSRRLRLPVSDIASVSNERIILRTTQEDIQGAASVD